MKKWRVNLPDLATALDATSVNELMQASGAALVVAANVSHNNRIFTL